MGRKYSKEETTNCIKKALDENIDQLYNAKCINWKGKTSDPKEYYSEVISKYLLEKNRLDEKISRINQIDRPCYKVKTHLKKISINKTNREEENFAKGLVWGTIGGIGKIIDFQVPLKETQKDKAGKIDLITYKDGKAGIAYIVELKYEGNDETLLRAVLEISTYYSQLNRPNFIDSFDEYTKNNLTKENIKKAVLLTEGSNAYREAKDLKNRPKLKELIEKLDVAIFVLPLEAERLIL